MFNTNVLRHAIGLQKFGAKYAKRLQNASRFERIVRHSSGVVTSPLGQVKVPNEDLVQHVWKDCDSWSERPAAVSFSANTEFYSVCPLILGEFEYFKAWGLFRHAHFPEGATLTG